MEGDVEVELVSDDEYALLEVHMQAAECWPPPLPDIEDTHTHAQHALVPPLQRLRRRGLKVTDFAAQLWCEQQLQYSLEHPTLVVETKAMAQGTARHQQLEAEVHEIVEIETVTREDVWGVKLAKALGCVFELLLTGRTRELPVWGCMGDGVYVSGIADELTYKEGVLVLSDTKTRATRSLPGPAQTLTTRLQLCQYKAMFDGMRGGRFDLCGFLAWHGLDLDRCFGSALATHLQTLQPLPPSPTALRDLAGALLNAMAQLPEVGGLSVSYEYQGDGSSLGVCAVEYDADWLAVTIDHCMQYWMGHTQARGVEITETWKCSHCTFVDTCEWRMKKARELADTSGR